MRLSCRYLGMKKCRRVGRMQEIGKWICLLGVVMTLVGFVLWKLGDKLPFGKLPGDIAVQKEGYGFYFPITTCIVISLILTLISWLFRK